jgi:hypothetical protein
MHAAKQARQAEHDGPRAAGHAPRGRARSPREPSELDAPDEHAAKHSRDSVERATNRANAAETARTRAD